MEECAGEQKDGSRRLDDLWRLWSSLKDPLEFHVYHAQIVFHSLSLSLFLWRLNVARRHSPRHTIFSRIYWSIFRWRTPSGLEYNSLRIFSDAPVDLRVFELKPKNKTRVSILWITLIQWADVVWQVMCNLYYRAFLSRTSTYHLEIIGESIYPLMR